MRVDAATYGVGGVKERGMEVEREGGGQYQALPKGMFPTTVNVNVDVVDREANAGGTCLLPCRRHTAKKAGPLFVFLNFHRCGE